MKNGNQQVTNFLKLVLTAVQKQVVALLLSFSTYKIINLSDPDLTMLEDRSEISKIEGKRFDLVFGEFPFGMLLTERDNGTIRGCVQTSLRALNDKGKAFFIVEPNILATSKGKRFLDDLSAEGFYYNSIFELPEKILHPETGITPICLQFERQKCDKLFIATITDDCDTLFRSFNERVSTNFLESGMCVERDGFSSFGRFRADGEIDKLQTQYKEYVKYQLKNVALKIDSGHDMNTDEHNCIYIPMVSQLPVTSNVDTVESNRRNLFRITLNPEKVNAQYLALFFRSDLGRQILKSLRSGVVLSRIDRKDIEEYEIPIPPLEEQELLIRASKQLLKQQETVEQLHAELSLNPKNAEEIINIIKSEQDALTQYMEEGHIRNLIRKGETHQIEFKEGLKNRKTGGQSDKNVLKTIVGFLNTDGGTILVGVSDNKKTIGADVDGSAPEDRDKYILNIENRIETNIRKRASHRIKYQLFDIDGLPILKIECEPSKEPCYYIDNGIESFYVRYEVSTRELKEKDEQDRYIDYLKNNYNKRYDEWLLHRYGERQPWQIGL